jgi:small subunit ribosomal protein S1
MKQLLPTGLDEFMAEHKEGDAVTGRVVSVENGVAQVELGEGILVRCVLPVLVAEVPAEPVAAVAVGLVDLSAFSSMLKDKWKTGDAPAAKSAAEEKKSEAVKVGQVRGFTLAKVDAETKAIELTLA